jgi:hypothetical protein
MAAAVSSKKFANVYQGTRPQSDHRTQCKEYDPIRPFGRTSRITLSQEWQTAQWKILYFPGSWWRKQPATETLQLKNKENMNTVQNKRQKGTLWKEENVLANGVKQCRTNSVPYLVRKQAWYRFSASFP